MSTHPHKHTIYLPEYSDVEKLAAQESAKAGFEIGPGPLIRRAVQALLKKPEIILKMTKPSPKTKAE